MRKLFILILVGLICSPVFAQLKSIYTVTKGEVGFHSQSRDELIRAATDRISGVVDINKRTFVFKVTIAGFQGFNNPLQKEHFNESYMETSLYPEAIYIGRIIEDVDLTVDGTYYVRAKGKLKIHGVEREKIVKARIVVKDKTLFVTGDFVVPLMEHNIKVPRVVYDKVAQEIDVSIVATLEPR